MKKGHIKGLFSRIFTPSSKGEGMSGDRSRELQELLEDLSRIKDDLGRLHSSSESGFLDVGRKLQEIYSSSTGMSDLASTVVQSMTGEEIKSSISGLSFILEELKGHIGTSESSFDRIAKGLTDYQNTLAKVTSYFEKFRMLVLNLDMLGFFTRVENAHIYSGGLGFTSLTNDVKTLSKRIFEKSAQIQVKAQALSKLILQALSEFSKFKDSHKTQTAIMLTRSVSNYDILIDRHHSATSSAQSIVTESQNIMDRIGGIVSNLQLHDITTQQIQHVIEVIDSLQENLSSSAFSREEKAGLMAEVCSLQGSQIQNTRNEVYSAVQVIIENMEEISRHIHELLDETRKVTWASDNEGMTFMEELDSGISTIITCLDENITEQTGLTKTMSSVNSMVSEMSVFVDEIENLGLNLQLIALNARIKAAHIGNEGAALDTISGSIYELSKNSRTDTNDLSGMLVNVVEIAKEFDTSLASVHSGQEKGVQELVTNLKTLLEALHDMNNSVFSTLGQMNTMGEGIMEDITRAVRGITIHEEMKEILSGIVERLETISRRSRQLYPQSDRDNSSSFMQELEKYYTMESEYKIHAEHYGSGRETTSPDRQQQASEFGDNVELF